MKRDESQPMLSFLLFIWFILQFRIVCTCDYTPPLLTCRCSNGKFLPTQLTPEIDSLVINDSNLDALTPYDFSLLINLKSLFIDACNIPLTEGINLLVYLKHLSNLHIVNSNVTVKVMTLFSSAVNIRKLSLPQNKLTHIPKDFFRNLLKVESIDLSCNEIESVEMDAFKDLTNLVDIDLSHNRFGQLFDPSFFFYRTCVYCAALPNESRCPDSVVEKCRGNEQVDDLWRMFAGRNIFLEGNPLCDTFSVEDSEQSQLFGFTPASRLDPQDGDANQNNEAARKEPQNGDANQNNEAARKEPQDHEETRHQISTSTLPTESQDGGCSFLGVGRCPRRLKKRHLFLSRVCRKRNKYASASGAHDPALHPPHQEIPDDIGGHSSASDHEGNYSSARVPEDESDEAEERPAAEGEGRGEVGRDCEREQRGGEECRGEGTRGGRSGIEAGKTAFWRRTFQLTFLQAFILLTVIGVVALLMVLAVRACRKWRAPPASTFGGAQTLPAETWKLFGSHDSRVTTGSTVSTGYRSDPSQ